MWALLGLLALLAISAPWCTIPVDNADSAGMQAHLHALFEDRDLLYDDEYAALRMSPLFAFVTERGVVSNHWPIGASFVQAPGWLLGRLAGTWLVGEGVSERAATWTLPLLGLRCWALLVCAWLLLGVFRWLRGRVGPHVAGLATAALGLGTPLLYYAGESPLRPHLWGAAVVAVLIMRWYDASETASREPARARERLQPALELAAWAGLATAIRPQLAMLALLLAHERWLASVGLPRAARVRMLLGHGAASALVFAAWPLLIVRMQWWMYGGASDYAGTVTHHVRAFLLSTHHGALVWCPVLVLGLLGLAIGLASGRRGAGLLLLLVAAQVWLDAGTREIEPYTVLGTRTWTGGTAFGPRKLLDAMPLMLPGVVWLASWLRGQDELARRTWSRRLVAVTVLSLAITSALLAAAFIDPALCSTVIDGERLLVALQLGLDPTNWSQAIATRMLPGHLIATLWLVVALPLAAVVACALAWPVARAARWPWMAVLAAGIAAQAWLSLLEHNSAARLQAQPRRMSDAAARMHPWHEATVAEIPRHHEQLRERLGPDAAP